MPRSFMFDAENSQWEGVSEDSTDRLYLAGPFFNHEQRSLFLELESVLNDAQVDYYSPRKESEGRGFIIRNNQEADEALSHDMAELMRCTVVLAILDYRLPVGTQLRLCHSHSTTRDATIHLPDSGTVWELGYMKALDTPAYGLFTSDAPLNIMLARTLDGVFRSVDDVKAWVCGGPPPSEFEGRLF